MKKMLFFFLVCFLTLQLSAQWTNNTSVNTLVSGLNASDQETAATSDGKTWIAFYSQNSSTGNYDMRAQLLDANGYRLLGTDGLLVSSQPSGSATFVFNVCTDIFDNLIIAFQYEIGGALNAVVTKVNTDGTLPWGAGVVLGEGLAPYPAVSKTNEVFVSWNNNSPSTAYVQKISSTGVLAWSTPTAITVGASNTTRAQLVCNANGDFTAVFQKKSFGISTTLYAQRYTTDGAAIWAAPLQISNQTSSAARYYSILADGNTVYYGYYTALGSRFFAFVQKITSSGTLPWGINGAPVTTYSSGADPMPQTTNIALDPASPNIWSVSTYSNTAQSAYGVFVQKIDTTSGNPLLNPAGKEVYPISSNYDTQSGELLLLNGGPFFMSYDINYKIYATRLNNVGDFVWAGNRVEISSTTAGPGAPKGRFAFSRAAGDQGVAVWHEDRGGDFLSYAQNIQSNGTLPVTMLHCSAEKKNNQALIQWTTSCEINCDKFVVEKSTDGVHFSNMATIRSFSAGGYCNNSNSYSQQDAMPNPINFYRIRQVDVDGRSSVSKVMALAFSGKDDIQISNRANITKIVFGNAEFYGNNVRLLFTDSKGRKMAVAQTVLSVSNPTWEINTSNWAAGIYHLTICNQFGKSATVGFMIP